MEQLEFIDKEFARIELRVESTEVPSSQLYKLKVQSVITIANGSEKTQTTRPWTTTSCRGTVLVCRTSWGSSRKGLRIAPPEAPKNGYLFSKEGRDDVGYVAPIGLSGLCVDFFWIYEVPQPACMNYRTVRAHGCESTHGLGRTAPKEETSAMSSPSLNAIRTTRSIDPDAWCSSNATIYEEDGVAWQAVLNFTDISCSNKFSKVELIRDGDQFSVFYKSGRVGTKYPQVRNRSLPAQRALIWQLINSLSSLIRLRAVWWGLTDVQRNVVRFGTLANAKRVFQKYFAERTGNNWPLQEPFVKKPGKYVLVASRKRKFRKATHCCTGYWTRSQRWRSLSNQLVSHSVVLYENTYSKLSSRRSRTTSTRQFHTSLAYAHTHLRSVSNFHDSCKKKRRRADIHQLDARYRLLNTMMEPLDALDKEYQRILRYVESTECTASQGYNLNIVSVMKVARGPEKTPHAIFKSTDNHKLLWHGTGLSNVVGILSQGLQVAPHGVPLSGSPLGRGVRNAKSAACGSTFASQTDAIPLTPNDTRGVYLLFFDGGSRGNPGPGGTGSIIVRVHKDLHTASLIWAASMAYSRKDTTNNFAEYWGLIH
ncbi:Poly polymerase catalytic domain containing protein, partial [Globisporangium splendens]